MVESAEVSYETVEASSGRELSRMRLAEVTGVIEVPRDVKPSSFVGLSVERLDGRLCGHEAKIERAYTLPRRRWETWRGTHKRIKFIAR